MSVIAIVNRKGGSGKSTLATHLAAHYASTGVLVMLGDVDRQQSTQTWLRLRHAHELPHSAPIVGWGIDPRRVLRPPPGIHHVVLDTPGGLTGFDLARVVGYADVILMPVCNSVFDRESAADCHAELMALPRVASGRCKLAAIGMRLDARTKAIEALEAWAAALKVPFIGALREAQNYVRSVEQGLTVFDLPAAQAQTDLAQWQPIVAWLEVQLQALRRLTAPRLGPASNPVLAGAGGALAARASAPALHVSASVLDALPASLTAASTLTTATGGSPNPAAWADETTTCGSSPADSPVPHAKATRAEPVADSTRPRHSVSAPAEALERRTPAVVLAGVLGWLTAPRFHQRNP